MLTAHSPEELLPSLGTRDTCVTIGNFDGVHAGHRVLIARTRYKASRHALSTLVVTFWPHPLSVLAGRRAPQRIATRRQRLLQLERLGADFVLDLPFTTELAALTPEAFIRRLLLPLRMRELVIGYDFSLGKGRSGNGDVLAGLGKQLGFGVEQLSPVLVNGAVVSSTRIRDLLLQGEVWDLRALLGRFHVLDGVVVGGYGRGVDVLGFPTANIDIPDVILPRHGVYAVWAVCQDRCWPAVTNIGCNPTFGNDKVSVETFLLDADVRLYDEYLQLHFVQRLRDEQRFPSPDALKARIAQDVRLARAILASPEAKLKL